MLAPALPSSVLFSVLPVASMSAEPSRVSFSRLSAEGEGHLALDQVDAAGRAGERFDDLVAEIVDHVDVRAFAALQDVGAVAAVQGVGAVVADQVIDAGIAGRLEGGGSGQRGILDQAAGKGGEIDADAGAHQVGGVGIALLVDLVAHRVHDIGVVADAALHQVVADAAIQQIVAAAAREGSLPPLPISVSLPPAPSRLSAPRRR